MKNQLLFAQTISWSYIFMREKNEEIKSKRIWTRQNTLFDRLAVTGFAHTPSATKIIWKLRRSDSGDGSWIKS